MTDLISRPMRSSAGRGPVPGSTPEPTPRPLSAAAAMGGAVAAGVTLVVCLSLALTGWFLADGGGHGNTTDALRVGTDGWLAGHGSRLVVEGLPLGITPLAITMMLVLAAFRAGRWCARGAAEVTEDRTLAGGIGVFVCSYLVVLVVASVLASHSGTEASLPRALFGACLIAGLGGGAGLASGTGRLETWIRRVPVWAREVGAGGISAALGLLFAASVLVAVSLLMSFNEAATALSELHLSTGDAVAYTAVAALLAPNAVLFAAAYLVGPGFSVGVGTTVSPTAVSLGLVPSFPMLAALPDEGPTPGWLIGLLAVPVLVSAVGVGLSRRRAEPAPYDLAAARGAASGFVGGVLITLAIALSGGPMGTGRLSDIGAPVAEVFVFATGLMVVGGLIGGVVTTFWQRRRR